MNHIYKVIWNTITQTWVAVSELSRAKGKTKSSKTLSAVVLAAVSAGAIVGDAEAARSTIPPGEALGNGMAIGTNSYANKNSVAYGVAAKANDGYAVAIGANAVTERVAAGSVGVANSRGQIAIGSNSYAKKEGDTAIGSNAKAEGQFSTAVGNGAQALGNNSSAFGEGAQAKADYSTALGKGAEAKEMYSIALGKESHAEKSFSTSVGFKTEAKGLSSLALGSGVVPSKDLTGDGRVDEDDIALNRTIADGNAAFAAGASANATGSYASALGGESKATANAALAVGKMANASANSTIAVGDNAQASGEKATSIGAGAIAKNEGTIAIGDRAKVGATNGDVAATNGIAIGTESESKDLQAIAVGNKAIAAGNNSIALGNETKTTGGNGVAIGNKASASAHSAAFGSEAEATAAGGYSSAFGQKSKATAADASAFGNESKALATNATSVGAHSKVDTGATYGSALGREASVTAANGTALGSLSSVTAANGTAVGTSATVTTAGGVALGQGSLSGRGALDKNKVKITAGHVEDSEGISQNDDKNNKNGDVYAPVKLIDKAEVLERVKNTILGSAGAVSLGKDGETTRQLTNLAPGSKDSDAVNVAQLKAVVGSIVKYNVTSPDNSITIDPTSETDKYGNRKTTFNVKMNTDAVKNAAAWNLKEGSETGNGEQVRGGDTVSFTDTATINVARNGKTLTFNANTASMSADGNNEGKIWTSDSPNRYLAKTKNVVDAINASGWILQANGNKVGLVNPGDKVNIASGNGITVTPTTEANGVSKITIDATVAGIKAGHNVTVETKDGVSTISAIDTNTQASVSKLNNNSPITINSAGTNSAGAKDYKLDVNVDGKTITKTGGVLKAVTGNLNVNSNGNLDTPQTGSALVNATTLTNVVNNTYWKAAAGGNHADGKENLPADKVKSSSTVTFNAGKNLTVDHSVANNFTFALNNTVDLTDKGSLTIGKTKVDNGGITITPAAGKSPVTLTANGLNNGGNTITNVAEGVNDTDAVNLKQLKANISTESVDAATLTGDTNIATITVADNKSTGDKNAKYLVGVSKNTVKEAAREAIDVKGESFISVSNETKNGTEIHTVKATTGEVSVDTNTGAANTTDATGLTTNKAVADAINASGWKISQDGTSKGIVNPGNEVSFKGGEGTEVTVSDVDGNGKRTVTIASTVKPNEKGVIEEVTENGTGENAAKKGQVKAKSGDENNVTTAENVANMINKAKWFAKAENNEDQVTDKTDDSNSDGQAMSAGDKLTLKAGKNLSVNRTNGVFTFALNNTVDLTDKGSLTIGGTTVTDGGMTIKAKEAGKTDVTLTANGLNNGGNTITNVAKGTDDTDAVNVKQLKDTELHIAPTKANGEASGVTYTYDDETKSVTLKYKDGNGKVIENTEAKIDLSGLASKIKDYSFKTNATGSNLVETGTETTVASGKSVNFAASDNLTLKQDVKDGNVTYTYGLKNQVVVGEKGTPGADGKSGKDGVDGSIGVNGKDGSAVAINGKDGSIGLNGKDGKNGLTIKGRDGKVGVDGKDGETRLVYVEKADPTKPGSSDKTHELATLDDGQKYAGDNYVAAKDNQAESNVIAKKANERLDIVGGAKGNLTEDNIGVNAKDGKLHVQLAEKVNLGNKGSVTIGDTVVNNNGITINSSTAPNGVTNKTVSLTNQGLNNGGNKIVNVAEGTKDTDAVNVKQLKDFKSEVAEGGLTFAGNSGDAHKAKLNSTVNIKGGEGNTDADQFDNGKNVMTKVNGNTVTVSIKKTPEVEGINIIDTTGKVKVKLTQTDEGLKVSDGNNNVTRITNVKAGEKDTDAVNVKQLNAAKTEVTAGDNIDVRSSTGANGQTIYKVSANDTSAAVEAGSDHVKVTKAANTHKDGSTTVTDYTVDLSDKTKGDIGKGVKAYDKVTNEGLTFNADKGSTGVKKLGSKVSVNGDGKNITTTADENGVKVSMKDDIKVNSVTAKEVKVGDVNINENGINAGGKRITNVAPGKDGTDAVNVNQLKYVAGNISNQINNVDKGLRAGIAGALASGGLYHVTTAGKSMVSVGAGTYRGQNALAVGYSRLSDNGKVGVKFTVNSNSQGHAGASASVGYQW